jgi:flotillin
MRSMLIGAALPDVNFIPMMVVGVVLLVAAFMVLLIRQYRRCPSNRILVIYGKVKGQQAAKCIHGGGVFVVPLFQNYAFLSLEPMTIDIELTSALSKKNIRVNVPSTFTIGISTVPEIMNNAAERLLGLTDKEIAHQARDIILGQMRLVIATLSIEEINQDREKFLDLVNKNVNYELTKIGLEMINVNIRDITDESGYIEALGQRAASEAINQAKVEVAEADRQGAIGTATADRDKDVQVAEQVAQSKMGQKQAERDQRIEVASLEAGALKGENESKAHIADYEATLEERRADAKRRGEVALANSARDVLVAEKEQELARLEKTELAQQMIERKRIEIDADAEAERIRRIARGEADGVLAKYNAEAEGLRNVLESKAEGYKRLLDICGDRKDLAPSLLIIEKLPELVAEQVKAIQNLKIDKITVWDSGPGSGDGSTGTTGNFLKGMIGALPPIHELAQQAGIELPKFLGQVAETEVAEKKGKDENPAS